MMLYAFVKSFLLVTIHMVHLQPQMANNTLMLELLFSVNCGIQLTVVCHSEVSSLANLFQAW